jgi:hypothetical protein
MLHDGARIQLPPGEQIRLVSADLFRSELIRRAMKVPGEAFHNLR